MSNYNVKQIVIVGVIGFIVIGTISLYFYNTMNSKDEEYTTDEIENIEEGNEVNNDDINKLEDKENLETEIMVHITGCVESPGIVKLQGGARIINAIELAGGATKEADLDKLNLAYVLEDGEKIYIPSNNETEEKDYITKDSGDNAASTNYNNDKNEDKFVVNINTAGKEELEKLTGVGESTATKIINYRTENGKFKKIEEIKNVPGIGDAKFNNIKDSIKVN